LACSEENAVTPKFRGPNLSSEETINQYLFNIDDFYQLAHNVKSVYEVVVFGKRPLQLTTKAK
jgi:hypothetical protein